MNNLDVFRSQPRDTKIKLHGREAFEGMHKAGQLASAALDMLVPHVKPGVTTERLDELVRSRRRSTTAASPRPSAPPSTTSSATASPTPSR
jgi:methionine aminopeptidase